MVHNSKMKKAMYVINNKLVMALDLQFTLELTLLFLHMFFIVVFASLPLVSLLLVFVTFQQSFLHSFCLLQKQNNKNNKNKVTNSNHNCHYYLHAITCQNDAFASPFKVSASITLKPFLLYSFYFS
jgi:hypothetical protein